MILKIEATKWIIEGQKKQWPKEKWQKTNNDLQNSTQHQKSHKKNKGELRFSERVISSWSTSYIRYATLAKRKVVSKSGKIYCDLGVVLVCLIPILYWFIF